MTRMFRRMESTNVGVQVDRTYHAGGQFQWARETAVNAIEAGATRVEYSVEWQAVEKFGVYRRMIADNGKGMSAEELETFFNTYGGGGKTIGPLVDNFGVGAKTSLLPWNHYGVVVISWVDGDPSMIWIEYDPETHDYGLKLHQAEGEDGQIELTAVVEPYDDPEHGIDWSLVKPDWIKENGTVIILMGNDPETDTVLGDPNRDERGLRHLAGYLNRRFWQLNGGQTTIFVHEFTSVEKEKWPQRAPQKMGVDLGVLSRQIHGMRYWITEPMLRRETQARLEQGTVDLGGGVEIDWYLWHELPQMWQYTGAQKGFIGVLHAGELYNITSNLSDYRTFRISEKPVRNQLWLIIRAIPHDPETRRGVFPTIDRNQLRWGTGDRLPFNQWGEAFSENLPEQIFRALQNCRRSAEHSITDPEWEKRLLQKFASRKALEHKSRHDAAGSSTAGALTSYAQERSHDLDRPPQAPRLSQDPHAPRRPRVKRRKPNLAVAGVINPARPAKVTGALPKCIVVHEEDAIESGMLAAYSPPGPDLPGGLITLYGSHPIMLREIVYWQQLYGDHQAAQVQDEVLEVYSQVAVAKVAHSEEMRSYVDPALIDDPEKGMRSPQALTAALLGLYSEELLILQHLARKLGRAKKREKVA